MVPRTPPCGSAGLLRALVLAALPPSDTGAVWRLSIRLLTTTTSVSTTTSPVVNEAELFDYDINGATALARLFVYKEVEVLRKYIDNYGQIEPQI